MQQGSGHTQPATTELGTTPITVKKVSFTYYRVQQRAD